MGAWRRERWGGCGCYGGGRCHVPKLSVGFDAQQLPGVDRVGIVQVVDLEQFSNRESVLASDAGERLPFLHTMGARRCWQDQGNAQRLPFDDGIWIFQLIERQDFLCIHAIAGCNLAQRFA